MDIYIERTYKGGLIEEGPSRMTFINAVSFESNDEGFFINEKDVTDEIVNNFGRGQTIQILIKDFTPE